MREFEERREGMGGPTEYQVGYIGVGRADTQTNSRKLLSPDFVALMHQANADAKSRIHRNTNMPKPTNRDYNKNGLIALYESGQLVQGDLSDQNSFTFKDCEGEREVGFNPVVINIGTKKQHDIWTLRVPVKAEDKGIFLPKTKAKPKI